MTPQGQEPLEEIPGDLLVLFHFEDIPVPRGSLGRVDWYLCGAVSRLSVDGKFTGALGTVALFPPAGKFQVQKILVFGLGPRSQLTLPVLERAAAELQKSISGLQAQEIFLALPRLLSLSPEAVMRVFAQALSPFPITFLLHEVPDLTPTTPADR
jgi:hypothetical protein